MAKTKEEDFESFVDEEPIAPVSINKYDPFQLKAGIDDCIINLLEERNYVEDHGFMDQKIVICALQIGITLVSQFYKPDPSWDFLVNVPFQLFCVFLYCVGQAAAYWIENYAKDTIFFIAKKHPVSLFTFLISFR